MASTTWWGPSLLGKPGWSLPDDLWATLAAAQRLLHGNLGGLYTPPTRLITFPGAAVILIPLVAVTDAAGLSLQVQNAHNLHPAVWLLAGPYEIALSAVALFAADAIAERLGADRAKRAVLAGASAVALWSVSVRWGHPEDAVAVGLLLYAILALSKARTGRAAWLTGAAVAIQPLVLLALPVVAVVVEPRRLAGFLARAAAPAAVLLGAAAAANWTATFHAVTSQPNWVTVDQATPVGFPRPAHRHRPGGRRRARPGPGHPRGLRMRAGRRAPVARGARRAAVEHARPCRGAVVDRRGPGAPLGVRAGDGRVLPVARAGGGAHRRVEKLVAPDPGLRRRRGAHPGLAAHLARPVELVGTDGRRARPDPVLRPDPRRPRPVLSEAVSDWQTRSFWMSRRHYAAGAAPGRRPAADVAIIGAGFTGLWTAIHLKEADPAIDVIVVERDIAGYGASGRNGGFAMTMVGRNVHDLVRKVGVTRAKATHLAMRQTLRDIESFCAAEGIDADITRPGVLTVSNGPEQDVRIRQDLAAAAAAWPGRFPPAVAAGVPGPGPQRAAQDGPLRATTRCWWTRPRSPGGCAGPPGGGACASSSTHPVDDLTEVRGRGPQARTPFGTVRADRMLIATNAYAHAIPALRRFIFTIYAYIIVTEPLTPAQWARVGWERRMGVEDKRIYPHFHRPTPDGRILWGGRDAPFSAEGPNPGRENDPRIFRRLEETFRWTFPQLHDVAIDRGWAGPVCGTINCFASAGFLGRSAAPRLRARLRRPRCGPLAPGRQDRARPAARLAQRTARPAHGEQAPGTAAAGPAARRDAGPRRAGAAARRRSRQRRIAPGPAGAADPPVAPRR